MHYGSGFGKITPMKENFRGVKVRWLTKAVAIFLELKEVEYSMICYNKRNKTSKKAYPKQKTYQNNVWHQKKDLKKFQFFPIFVRFKKIQLRHFKKIFLKILILANIFNFVLNFLEGKGQLFLKIITIY